MIIETIGTNNLRKIPKIIILNFKATIFLFSP